MKRLLLLVMMSGCSSVNDDSDQSGLNCGYDHDTYTAITESPDECLHLYGDGYLFTDRSENVCISGGHYCAKIHNGTTIMYWREITTQSRFNVVAVPCDEETECPIY